MQSHQNADNPDMDFSFGSLFSSLMISTIGAAMIMFGRKASKMMFVLVGLILCVYPYFVTSVALMWGIAGVLFVLMYIFRNNM